MKPPTTTDINTTLRAIEATERSPDHARALAREAVARWQRGSVIDPDYDFNAQPVELRRIAYDATVRFSRRRWWSRLLR